MEHLTFLWWNLIVQLLSHAPVVTMLQLGAAFGFGASRQIKRGLAQGIPAPLVGLMASYQYLTMWTQMLTILYLVASVRGWEHAVSIMRAILFPAGSLVGVLWFTLLNWSPMPDVVSPPWSVIDRSQFPADDAAAERAVRALIIPTFGWLLPIWITLHIQHVAMPLLPWLEVLLYGATPPALTALEELAACLTYLAAYLLWAIGLCWRGTGDPPYPILRCLLHGGRAHWMPFYGLIFLLFAVTSLGTHTLRSCFL